MDHQPEESRDGLLASIPTETLLAILRSRDDGDTKPQCGSGKKESYDTWLHIGALILILFLSTISCLMPLLSRASLRSRRPSKIIFYCQHFGTGVLIATAFVHLLPTAFTSLTDPCLPSFFNKKYRPLAGLIAMIFALAVVALESYLTTRGAGHSHSHGAEMWDSDDEDNKQLQQNGGGFQANGGLSGRRARGHRPGSIEMDDVTTTSGLMAGVSPLPETTPTNQTSRPNEPGRRSTASRSSIGDDDRESLELDFTQDELSQTPLKEQRQPLTNPNRPPRHSGEESGLPQNLPDPEEQRRLWLQCLLLEAGILFHSVFIGMALSVASGPAFVMFLIAIAFHQSFEGLALGSRIAAIHFPRSSWKPWVMVLMYGVTTPLGQAIGLLVHNFYDPMSQTGLLMVGFMNAISSGLLVFAGLVQLLAEDFLTEKSYETLKGRRRLHAFLAVLAGAGLMAGVGAIA